MMIKGLIFDINGTVTNILTNEADDNLYRVTANFLDYNGVQIQPDTLRERFFELNNQQRKDSGEQYPEFDVVAIFKDIILKYRIDVINHVHELAQSTALVFRAASRFRLEPYPDVLKTLQTLKKSYNMAVVSDGQAIWAYPELRSTGLANFFSPILISSDFGFRKPDERFFQAALQQLNLKPDEAIYIGNDLFRDVYGAYQAGMKTIFFKSNQGDHTDHGANPDYVIYNFAELPKAIDYIVQSMKADPNRQKNTPKRMLNG